MIKDIIFILNYLNFDKSIIRQYYIDRDMLRIERVSVFSSKYGIRSSYTETFSITYHVYTSLLAYFTYLLQIKERHE